MSKQKPRRYREKCVYTSRGLGFKNISGTKTVTGKNLNPRRTGETPENVSASDFKRSACKICYMHKKNVKTSLLVKYRLNAHHQSLGPRVLLLAGSAFLSYLTYSLLFSSVTGMFLPLGLSSCWRNLPKALCSTQNV